MLAENAEHNLTGRQVEFAQTIYASGTDLLALINDILDLSKIEAGTMSLDLSDVVLSDVGDDMERNFRQVAETKKLDYSINIQEEVSNHLYTDSKRLRQVLKNLLSNALKFTERGEVQLNISVAESGWSLENRILSSAPKVLAFAVTDTGIGIPSDKQKIIFEAFHQADGTTSRKYGGTGLGLAISREIARLLGGEIRVESAPGRGSTFTLYIPATYMPPRPAALRSIDGDDLAEIEPVSIEALNDEYYEEPASPDTGGHKDDRTDLEPDDHILLIVGDESEIFEPVLEKSRECGFKGVIARSGHAALSLVRRYKPHAIAMDLALPDMDGYSLLDRLKHDPSTRHIPVQIISSQEERVKGLRLGAVSVVSKPLTLEKLEESLNRIKNYIERDKKRLLIVEDNTDQRNAMVELIGNGDVEVVQAGSGEEAIQQLEDGMFDCMVLDLGLPDMPGVELIDRMRQDLNLHDLPIVVYTGRELSRAETSELKKVTDAVIIKDASSPERLLAHTALYLHRQEASLPEATRRMLEGVRRKDPVLSGRKILLVDDDVRNIFALTAALESHEMIVLYAENGKDAIEILQNNPDMEAVIMDIMLPEMDGYEATRVIRTMPEYENLPIIALTAKAMKGDREKCLEAGASEYVAKPVDTDQLLSLLRVWLYR